MEYAQIYKDSPYLKSIELLGKTFSTIITDVKKELIIDASRPDEKEEGLMVYMHGIKRFICNIKNFKRISMIAGSAETDDWIGKVIVLYAEKGKWFGVEQTALRVMPQPENFTQFLEQSNSIEDLKERHVLLGSRSNDKLVTELVKKFKDG